MTHPYVCNSDRENSTVPLRCVSNVLSPGADALQYIKFSNNFQLLSMYMIEHTARENMQFYFTGKHSSKQQL